MNHTQLTNERQPIQAFEPLFLCDSAFAVAAASQEGSSVIHGVTGNDAQNVLASGVSDMAEVAHGLRAKIIDCNTSRASSEKVLDEANNITTSLESRRSYHASSIGAKTLLIIRDLDGLVGANKATPSEGQNAAYRSIERILGSNNQGSAAKFSLCAISKTTWGQNPRMDNLFEAFAEDKAFYGTGDVPAKEPSVVGRGDRMSESEQDGSTRQAERVLVAA